MEQAIQIERELSEIKAKQAAAEEQHKTIFHRLDKQDKMIEVVQGLVCAVDHMSTRLDTACNDLNEIKSKPAKRWETVTMKIVEIVVAALVGFILAKMGVV